MRLRTWAFLTLLVFATPTYAARPTEPVRARLADGREVQLRGSVLELIAAGRPSPAPAGRHALQSKAVLVTDATGLVTEAIGADGRSLARNLRGVDPDVLIGVIPLPSPHPTPPAAAQAEPGAIPLPSPHPAPSEGGGSRIKPRK